MKFNPFYCPICSSYRSTLLSVKRSGPKPLDCVQILLPEIKVKPASVKCIVSCFGGILKISHVHGLKPTYISHMHKPLCNYDSQLQWWRFLLRPQCYQSTCIYMHVNILNIYRIYKYSNYSEELISDEYIADHVYTVVYIIHVCVYHK